MPVVVNQFPHRDAAVPDAEGRLDDGTFPVHAALEFGATTFVSGKSPQHAMPPGANDPMVKTASSAASSALAASPSEQEPVVSKAKAPAPVAKSGKRRK